MSSLLDSLQLSGDGALRVEHSRHDPPRIVVVGQHLSGKRTILKGLLQADSRHGVTEDVLRRLAAHGCGVSHAHVLPQAHRSTGAVSKSAAESDGAASCGLETYVCDHVEALCVALPTLQIATRSVIVFVVDFAEVESVQDQLHSWTNAVRRHVSALCCGSQKSASAAGDIRRLCESRRSDFEAHATFAARTSTAGDDSADAEPMAWFRAQLLREAQQLGSTGQHTGDAAAPRLVLDGVCPLRSVVIGNKLDVLEQRCRDEASSAAKTGSLKLPPAAYVVQVLRKEALLMCSDFCTLTASALQPAAYRAILRRLETLSQTRDSEGTQSPAYSDGAAGPSPADNASEALPSLSALVHCSRQQGGGLRYIPAGADALALLHPYVCSERLLPISSLFHSAADGGDGDGSAAAAVTHEALLHDVESRDEEMLWDMMS